MQLFHITANGKWSKMIGSFPVMAGTGIPYGEDKILLFGGVEEILEAYMNTINLGQNCLGVQSAAKRYFNKRCV